jgi:DNA-binding CsgD family transcriptional regulator
VRFFDGDVNDAFVLAVRSNIAHGLPLSLTDRKVSAERIIRSHPMWSDRTIATATGLAAKTVRTLRRRLTEQVPQVDSRIGRDGRVRPLTCAQGRTAAAELLRDNPEASLRTVARVAGISPETVRDVRARLRRGGDPLNPGLSPTPRGEPANDGAIRDEYRSAALERLRRDPSMRFTELGRMLLRLLEIHTRTADWTQLADEVPAHCVDVVAEMVLDCAQAWQVFGRSLKVRSASVRKRR